MAKQKQKKKQEDPNSRLVCRNRRANHEYEILDELECGVILQGSEVKSIRAGKVSIDEAFARVQGDEVWLYGCDVATYPQATVFNHEPKRRRKLLLHKREIRKFADTASQRGLTLIPLALYFSNGRIKIKLAVGRGRKLHDKREKLKKASAQEDMRRAIARGGSRD